MATFTAKFSTDGTGDFSVQLPSDADEHDVLALTPVIKSIRKYLAPTLHPDGRDAAVAANGLWATR